MLTIVTWLWGDKFGPDHVAKLAAGVRRNMQQKHRFICISERPDQVPKGIERLPIGRHSFLKVRGCFARLEMFDPEWMPRYGIERLACVDLDTIITGALDPLFDRPEPFVIMQSGNAANPCPYNGALMLLRAGAHPEVWNDFSLEAASKVPFYSFPDDQGWLAHKVPGAAGWKVGPEHGIYVYQKPGWPGRKNGTGLPDGARLVTFINRDPSQLTHLDWVREHWR